MVKHIILMFLAIGSLSLAEHGTEGRVSRGLTSNESESSGTWVVMNCNDDGTCLYRNTSTGETERRMTQPDGGKGPSAPAAAEIHNLKEYGKVMREGFKGGTQVVVLTFGNEKRCPPCRTLAGTINRMKGNVAGVTFAHVNIDEARDLAEYFQKHGKSISSIPHTFVFKRNEDKKWWDVRSAFVGAENQQQLINRINQAK